MQRLDAPHRGELSFSICGTAAALLNGGLPLQAVRINGDQAASDTEGARNNVRRQWSVQGVLRFPPLRSHRGTVTHDASEDAQGRARCGASGEFP